MLYIKSEKSLPRGDTPRFSSTSAPRVQASNKMSRDSVLFPDVKAWAASIEAYNSPPLTLSLPGGTLKPTEVQSPSTMTSFENDSIMFTDILDQAVLDLGFDSSCLEGLDEQLLWCPSASFADLCYEEAVENPLPVRRTTPTPQPSPGSFELQGRFTDSASSDDSDSDTDECRTCDDGDELMSPWYGSISEVHPVGDFTQLDRENGTSFFDALCPPSPTIDDGSSFIILGPPYSAPKPEEYIGYFPVPTNASKTKSGRIATFVSNLPRPWVRSATSPIRVA